MLTPIEIQDKSFKSGIGYDKKDVDAFLRDILKNYELLYTKNAELEDKVAVLSEGISHYKSNEKSIQKALVLAQSVADEIIATANKKAQAIEEKAYAKSDEILLNSKTELNRLNTKISDLTLKFESYKNSCKHFALAQLEMLDNNIFTSSLNYNEPTKSPVSEASETVSKKEANPYEATQKPVTTFSNANGVNTYNSILNANAGNIADSVVNANASNTDVSVVNASLVNTVDSVIDFNSENTVTKEATQSKGKSILKKKSTKKKEIEDYTVNIDFNDFEENTISKESPISRETAASNKTTASKETIASNKTNVSTKNLFDTDKAKEETILTFDNTFSEVSSEDVKTDLADEFNIGITFSENTKFNPDDSIRYYEDQVSEKEDKIVKEAKLSAQDDEFIFDDVDDDSNSIGIDFDFLNTRK